MKKFTGVYKSIQEFKKNVEILPTGLESIDAYLDGGFLKKELVILGAPTGKGKSLVAGQIFKNIAKKGFKSAYFSLEINNEMLGSRLLGEESNISPTRIMIHVLDDKDEKKVLEAKAEISPYEEFMFFYDDLYILAEIQKEIREGGYDFVVVDFIQNVVAKGEEYERLSFIALEFQKLAKSTNTCILVLSQLSNMMARDKKSTAVEYKGSGSIGMVADLGFFIEEGTSGEQSMAIRLRKNRRGISGGVFNFAVAQPGGRLVAM